MSEVRSTTDYKIFRFRDDNRDGGIDMAHVRTLIKSLQKCNLLKYRPIVINENYEIIDGQHRVKAAEALGLEIYYQVQENSKNTDIMRFQVQKNWGLNDYHNFYNKNGYAEYQKLDVIMKRYNINAPIAMKLFFSNTHDAYEDFKNGDFKYENISNLESMDMCQDVINSLKKTIGSKMFWHSLKVWKSVHTMVTHPNFNFDQWVKNLRRLQDRVYLAGTQKEQLKHFVYIHNYSSSNKIEIEESIALRE